MALTKVGVKYSSSQKVRRELIVASTDALVDVHKSTILPGEAWLDIPIETFNAFTTPQEVDTYLQGILGNPTSDYCLIIDGTNTIVSIVRADPIIDDHPDGVIIQDTYAQVGWNYDFENAVVLNPNPAIDGALPGQGAKDGTTSVTIDGVTTTATQGSQS